MNMRLLFTFTALLLLTISCGNGGPASAPSITPSFDTTVIADPSPSTTATTDTEQQTPTKLPTKSPTATYIPTTPPIPETISAEGTWVLYKNDDGLWLTNKNGAALKNLVTGSVETPYDISPLVSQDGSHLAFLTAKKTFFEVTLNVITLPDGDLILKLPLTSSQTEPAPDALQGDSKLETVSAFVYTDSLAWSPDGRNLAFMGAQEGPTSDLYVYSLDSGTTTRLTDGPSQGIKPSWSPDGEYILHAGVSTLGTGAGYGMQGVWAAAADGSDVITLYRPESGDESWLGWLDPETALVSSWSAGCETYNLRSLNIRSGEQETIWDGNFHAAAYDPQSSTVILVHTESYPSCGEESPGGLYLIPPDKPNPFQIGNAQGLALSRWTEVVWSAVHDQFLVGTDAGLLTISPSGDLHNIPSAGADMPLITPDGKTLAWVHTSMQENPGVWVADWGEEARQVYTEGAGWAYWTDNTQLLFITQDGLYLAGAPDFEPVLVQDGFWATGMALVSP